MTPLYSHPSSRIPLTVGSMIFFITSSSISFVTTGAGEYAPIPPVFNPVSPSPTLLWSCADANGTATSPPTTAKNDASSPNKVSSITIVSPASPNCLFNISSSMAFSASSTVSAIITPFPAAKPDVLITIGAPVTVLTYSFAFSASLKTSYVAVGMLYFLHKFFMNSLDPSNCAAFFDGPNTLIFSALKLSANPSTSGASGPTTTKSIAFDLQNFTTSA
mmetsp:Transcript_180/g.611  ORF Transcript_180/g.611 Transcript_180/m.611 type:complete len:219 (+) Transcript_180:575-1231(+)